jgi:hypothetical protein
VPCVTWVSHPSSFLHRDIHPSIARSRGCIRQARFVRGILILLAHDHMRARSAPTTSLSAAEQRKRPIDAFALSSLHILHAWHQVRAHTSHMKERRDVHYISRAHRGYIKDTRTHAAHELTTLICLFLFHARFCALCLSS